jgi:hypothetical protein
MHRLHLGEIHDAVAGTEAGELPDRLAVGAAGVGVADVRAEEVAAVPAPQDPLKRARAGKRLGLYRCTRQTDSLPHRFISHLHSGLFLFIVDKRLYGRVDVAAHETGL